MDAVDIDTAEDAHEDTIEETVPAVCRVCLLGHMIMRDLFVENDVVSLSTKAMSFASVKMLPEDGLPAHVCCDCADKLEAAYEFKLQVEQADNVLRQRYDTLNIKEELFFNEVEVHLEADRGEDVHSLDADAHYQATVDSLNPDDPDSKKPTLFKDHLALLEVEKLAKQQNVLGAEHKDDDAMSEEAGVTAMLRVNEDQIHYLHDSETSGVGLVDCSEDYREPVKPEVISDPDVTTSLEHNYIIQQGYTLTRNDDEELAVHESVDSVGNETVNYLSLIEDDTSAKEDSENPEISRTVEAEQPEEENTVKESDVSCEAVGRKRKFSKRRRTDDEENYFENLNLSSRLKTSKIEMPEKFYFLCYLCDRQFVSKETLKEHMHSHEEVRKTLSLTKVEKSEKPTSSPSKPVAPSTPSTSGKKANKCPYCGKEYLYVISFNKHVKQHEKNRDTSDKNPSFTGQDSLQPGAEDSEDSSDAREFETEMRIEASIGEDEDEDEENKENSENLRNPAGTISSTNKLKRRSSRSENSTYRCEKCPEKFTNKQRLVEHTSKHLTAFKCNTCDREFDELEKFRRHRAEHVVEGVLSQQDLEGNVYDRAFDPEAPEQSEDVATNIYSSSNLAEAENTIVSCSDQQEERVTVENEDLEENVDSENSWHLAIEDHDLDREDMKDIRLSEISDNWTEIKNHKCPDCGIACPSKKSLQRHMNCHVETPKEICKLCKEEFTSSNDLQEHLDNRHSARTKTFKCTDCGKTFNNELTLRNHLFATDHKTIIQGQQYDPNKRMKRVAARAAQKIIDKIKTEDNMVDDDEEEEDEDRDNKIDIKEEGTEYYPRNSKSYNSRWTSRQDGKIRDKLSSRKIEQHRNRRKCDYECESCGRKCSSKQSLTKHMEQHRVKDEAADNTDKLIDKQRRNNLSQIAERSFNDQRPSNLTSARRDERLEEDSDNEDSSDFGSGLDWPMDSHECPTCKKKYSTKKSLLRHQLLHEEPHFECDICNVKFYRKDKLKSHYDKCSEKNPDQVRKCNICGDTFENNDILKEHRGRHVEEGILTEEDLRETEPGTEERRESPKAARKRRTDIVGLECTECNKRYTSRKGLLRHIQVHEGKKYLCDICPKKFYRREHLKIHVAKHNMIKPYKCPRCTKCFIKEEQLSNHLSKHDRPFKKPKEADTSKRFLCEICSKSFTQSTTLIAHLRAHNGIKPYVCDVCARPFTTNAYLKMHMRTHTQERPYSCQYCSRAFARADTLANHLTSHTGEAKYHCKYCPKNFRRLKSLKEHVFIHTGQRPYACPTCDRRFNNNGSRYAHSKRCKQIIMQIPNRSQNNDVTSPVIVQNAQPHPIRLHQLTGSHKLLTDTEEDDPEMQLVKHEGIKTITIARSNDQITGHHQMIQHQEILMPLILPLTVTLTDVDEEVILPEGTNIYTTA